MRTTARLIDANANRAREGLRVLEDLARFALSDQIIAIELKSIRHALTEATERMLPTDIGLTARDAEGDVGRTVSTESESVRTDLRAVARAAAGRVGEALRVIEESSKVCGAHAEVVEALRYRVYDAGAAVVRGLVPIARQWTLCVLLSEKLCVMPWLRVAELAIEGGADCLQLREKSMPGRELVSRARLLVEIARPRGVSVIVNDRPDIALLAGAEGVHVGQNDLTVADARAVGGAGLFVGVSCSSVEAARAAVADGASMIGVGAMFDTRTKDRPQIRGTRLLGEVLAETGVDVPHLAIGGITPANADEVVAAGARGLAVSSCVCGSDDPGGVCRALVETVHDGVGGGG